MNPVEMPDRKKGKGSESKTELDSVGSSSVWSGDFDRLRRRHPGCAAPGKTLAATSAGKASASSPSATAPSTSPNFPIGSAGS